MDCFKTTYTFFLLGLLACLGGSHDVWAQSFSAKIRKVSVEDGLSNRFIRTVYQDSKGFVWLGTNYGLNRYDGYGFKLFTKETEGLPTNRVRKIYEGADTCIWVRFEEKKDGQSRVSDELSIIDLNTLSVYSFDERFGPDMPVQQDEIFELYQSAPQQLLIVTKSRAVYSYEKGRQCRLLFELPYPNHTLENIITSDQAVWVIGSGYILEYDQKGVLQQEELIPFKNILDLSREEDHLVGFAEYLQGDSLFKFVKYPSQPVEYAAPGFVSAELTRLSPLSLVHRAPNGLIWYSGMENRRMYARIYNERGELIYDFSSRLRQRVLQSILEIYFDQNNNVWIGTTNGIYILTIQDNRFHTYLNRDEFVPGSRAHSIRGIVEHNNDLYINSYDGRWRIDLATEEIQSMDKPIYITIREMGNYIRNPVLDAMKDHDDKLWFSGNQNTVQWYDPSNDSTRFYESKQNLPEDFLKSYGDSYHRIYEDSHHRIWVGSTNGIYYLDTTLQAFIKFNAHGKFKALNDGKVYAILEDTANNALWIGGSEGLFRYDYTAGVLVEHYSADSKGNFHLPEDYILCLHKDKHKNILWIGTHEGGLIRWDVEEHRYDHFTVASGLSDNMIYGILEDDNNCLWMSSNYGLMRFDKNTEWSTVYLPRDGITDKSFNMQSYYEADDGRFYFGSVNGVVAFYPSDFQGEAQSDLPLHVLSYETLSSNDKEMRDRTSELMRTGVIQLKPSDVFFRIRFALLDFRHPEQNRYSYKIEGSGQGWQYISENELRVNQLPYGDYTLLVRGQSIDGEWSRKELHIPIKVPAPFYKTTWFLVLLIIGILGVFIGLVRIYMRSEQMKKINLEREIANRTQKLRERERDLLKAKEEAEKSSHAKAEFLSVMSHEIRTPMNAVVNLTNYLLEDSPAVRQIENLNTLKFSANNLLAIINDVLDFNKIESGKVEFEAIEFDLLGLLDSIRYSMAVNARKKGIEFALETEYETTHLLVGDPNRLTQILNNLLSNAIKFTEKGRVQLLVRLVTESDRQIKLYFEVNDTGIGISEEEQQYIFNMFTQAASDTTRKYGGTGLGLAITRRLLQLQDSSIGLKSKVGEGSSFFFELTFGRGAPVGNKLVMGAPMEKDKQELEGKRILVVEDNSINVLVVKRFLEKWGVQFTHANDGIIATQKVQEQSFDLILMDIHMPNMDGYEAARIIRQQSASYCKTVPIIALTASALMDNRERVYEAGMNDIVVKPFKPAELYRILTQYIR